MRCNCGKTAVYLRVNEGRHYCSDCLTRQVERSFLKEIRKNPLGKETVAVGVSGGKDSMVLLHLMNKLVKKTRTKLVAITIDEGIAGYRDRCIDIAGKFANEHGIEHRIISFKDEIDFRVDELNEKKPCTYCGVFRRRLMNKAAREAGASRIVVGHNLDDEAQSILMNVIRSDTARMKRLGSHVEKENFVPRIKPLKNILKKEIVAYAIINNIPYFDGECPHSLDNVRRDVQKILNDLEAKYPGTKNQIVRFYEKIKIDEQPGEAGKCGKCGEPASQDVCKACELMEKAKGNIN